VTNDGGPTDSESEPFGTLPEAPDDADEAGDDLDDLEDGDAGQSTALPPRVEAWRKRSATGAVLTGFALGLQQALGKEQEQPAIVMQTSGDPPTDLPVEADVEQGRPRQSVVNIRPWLLANRTEETDPDAGSGTTDPDPDPGPSPRTEDT
jgi:hypothetical protein